MASIEDSERGGLARIADLLDRMADMVMDVITFIILTIAHSIMYVLELASLVIRRLTARFLRATKSLHIMLGSCLPKSTRLKVSRMIVYTGLTRNPEEILGITLIYSLILPIMLSLVAFSMELPVYTIIFVGVASLAMVWLFFYTFFALLMDKRTSSVEKVLPDVLTMISQNMVAGMTTYNALWVAARPEFGPLAVEIQTVARETLSGESFENALMAMSNRINSYKLTRAVKLMIQGMRSGGELPTVLQEIADDIRTEQNIFRRMRSDTTSQSMFILFALLIGAPLLLAASLQFVTIFNTIFTETGASEAGSIGMEGVTTISALEIEPEFFWNYSVALLGVSGFFGSILISLMRSGKLTSGATLMPILVPLPIIIFIILSDVLGSFFSGMLQIH